MRICEPCIFRCHDGHKGVRYVRELECACICEAACRIAGCTCNAKVISESQLDKQKSLNFFDQRCCWQFIVIQFLDLTRLKL